MKKAKTFNTEANQNMVCVHTTNFTDALSLDLYPALREAGKENILGPFTLSKNGLNYPNFKMRIDRFVFKESQAEPETKEKLGTWMAGFEEFDKSIIPEPGKDAIWQAHTALTVFRIVTVVVCKTKCKMRILIIHQLSF